MSKRATDILFNLIRSLEKAEKRHFKLYIKRNSANEDLKIIRLFDAIDKTMDYDEEKLLKKLPDIQKSQLSNLKSHLYKQILASLRLLKSTDSIDLQLNEQFDYAHILYKKGLYHQSLRLLEKAKEAARAHQKFTFLTQAIALEKRIESLYLTRGVQSRAEALAQEAIEISEHNDMVARLSGLALQLYSWYVKNGHARNEEDEEAIRVFMETHLPPNALEQTGFYEKLYLHQSLTWYAYIRQDFLAYYRYTQKWVDLFETYPLMKRVETGHYIKGLHNLLTAHFNLRNYRQLLNVLHRFEEFAQTERVQKNDSFRVQSFLHIAQAKMNAHFLAGTFKEGLRLVAPIEEKLNEYALFIDAHRLMVLNYKIASLYFGSGDYNTAIDYLQTIINEDAGLRYDLQCYARLMHLLAHYELGNYELLSYLSRSVYRFLAKMHNLTPLEIEILNFLRRSFSIQPGAMKQEMKKFLETVKGYEKDRYEIRVLVHIDIISWVESKVQNQPAHQIIAQKHAKEKRKLLKSDAA